MPTAIGYIELEARPRIGDTVTLPAGLKYVNEFYATNHVTSSERTVTIVEIFRDEIFWKIGEGESCYARYRRKAA